MEHRRQNVVSGKRSVVGFTLMEVLVMIVLLSIGLLGVVAMQHNVHRASQNAADASEAVAMAMEMMDRVRANPPARNATGGLTAPVRYQFIDSAGSDPACIGMFCTPDQVALTDAFEWLTQLEEALPGGVGVICQDDTPNDGAGGSDTTAWDPMCTADLSVLDTFVVKVAWDHDRDPSTDFVVYRLSFIP